jgi:hypothetical protein
LGRFFDAHVVERDNRRMRELADDACFLQEALAGFTAREFLGEELDGYLAADHGIVGACDAASGTGADDFENFVASDLHGDLSLRLMTIPVDE